jgi:hypothetical protein
LEKPGSGFGQKPVSGPVFRKNLYPDPDFVNPDPKRCYRRSLQHSKENIHHFKTIHFFVIFAHLDPDSDQTMEFL